MIRQFLLILSVGLLCDEWMLSAQTQTNQPPTPVIDLKPRCNEGKGWRFNDCGNGTITDLYTGLIWLKDTDCFDGNARLFNFEAAKNRAASLQSGECKLEDGSQKGMWRVPTAIELISLFRNGCKGVSIPDKVGNQCFGDGIPWAGRMDDLLFWSSISANASTGGSSTYAMFVNFQTPELVVPGGLKTQRMRLWPVRQETYKPQR